MQMSPFAVESCSLTDSDCSLAKSVSSILLFADSVAEIDSERVSSLKDKEDWVIPMVFTFPAMISIAESTALINALKSAAVAVDVNDIVP